MNDKTLPWGTCGEGKIDTALGCIPITDTNSMIAWALRWGVGIAGGIAFMMIIYGSFLVMVSRGDPKKLSAGQETITSAIMGILMLLFSVVILEFIGVDLLAIPGFGR